MAFSGSQNSWHTPFRRIMIPATPSGNVHVSAYSFGLRYKLYPIKVTFPSFEDLWGSDDHLPPKTIAIVFSKRMRQRNLKVRLLLVGVQ